MHGPKPLPYHVIQNECWFNKIFIRIKPVQGGYRNGGYPVKLTVEMNGKTVKRGTIEYKQNSKTLYETIEAKYRELHDKFLR